MAEEILPLVQGSTAEMDCILWATMVARHAVGAVAAPMRMSVPHGDVMERAVSLAESARDALVGDMKFFVGNQQLIKQCVGDISIKPRQFAFHDFNGLFATKYTLCHFRQAMAYIVYFATLAFGGVEFERFEVDVSLGHDERIGEVKLPTQCGHEL